MLIIRTGDGFGYLVMCHIGGGYSIDLENQIAGSQFAALISGAVLLIARALGRVLLTTWRCEANLRICGIEFG